MSENPRLDRIVALRKSLKVSPRPGLIDLFDELLEIYEETEKRVRALEKAHEETD